MAEAEQPYLRLYCVCGQKMKVTGSLFGRPGKCVACRQKIRIPRFEEIPPGTTEIHLKDHPEFLRGRSKAAPKATKDAPRQRDVVLRHRDETPPEESETPAEEDHVELTDSHVVSTLALDVLEPLRNLFSLGNKLQRQLETLNEDDIIHAEVKGRLARVKKVRADLEEQLRQMLMEVAIELAMTHDKIAQTQLSARIGEISYDDFRGDIYKQRSRRDSLERRQQNLRGWIATTDVQLAGGFVDVPPDSIPEDGFRVTVPSEPRTTAPLVDVHTSALRDAFDARSKAERTLAELNRMRGSSESKVDWKQARANAKSERTFAEANIEFRRERLGQLRSDYSEDLETLSAQLDMVRSRMQSGQLDRAAYDKEEKKLALGQADLKKALSIIDRALSANSAQDVPEAKGTFLGRMAADEQGGRDVQPLENGLAWAGAALLVLAILLPLIGNLSPLGAFIELDGLGSYSFLVLLVFGGIAAGAVFVRETQLRVLLLSVAWVVGLFVAAWIMREALYSIGPTSARFRTAPPLLLRPGFLAIVAATVAIIASTAMGMRRLGWWPVGPGILAIVGLFVMGVAVTDFAGIYRPAPELSVQVKQIADGRGQFAQVAVSNSGGRTMYLFPAASDARSAYQLFVERRIGLNSWAEISPSAYASSRGASVEAIAPGETDTKTVSLEGGNYRALLVSKALDYRSEEQFVIESASPEVDDSGAGSGTPESPQAETTTGEAPEAPTAAAPEPAPQEVTMVMPETEPTPADTEPVESAEPEAPHLEVAFQGAGARAEGQYRLSFIVYLPDAPSQRIFVSLGEEIVEGWTASQYEPSGNRVTLTRDGDRRILAPGEVARLDE